MRELLTLHWIRTLCVGAGVVAAICLSIATIQLASLVGQQQDRLAHQSLELECRGEVAAEVDVIRSEITLHLSRGLRALVVENEIALQEQIRILEGLDDDLNAAADRRARTTQLCADGESDG